MTDIPIYGEAVGDTNEVANGAGLGAVGAVRSIVGIVKAIDPSIHRASNAYCKLAKKSIQTKPLPLLKAG